MDTQSTHTQHKRQRRYVPGSSRKPRSAATLLAQVADKQRGERIRERREELHLTQPAVVELLEEAAEALPPTHELHPEKLGKAPLTLRGLQTYEQGGGIVWEKAKLLAQVLQMDVQAMMSGEREQGPTPDPFPPANDALADRLDAIEATLTELRRERAEGMREVQEYLQRQDAILTRIEAAIQREDKLRAETEEFARLAREVVAGRPLPEDESDSQPVPQPTEAEGSSAGAASSPPGRP